MKDKASKIVALMLAICMVLNLVACGDGTTIAKVGGNVKDFPLSMGSVNNVSDINYDENVPEINNEEEKSSSICSKVDSGTNVVENVEKQNMILTEKQEQEVSDKEADLVCEENTTIVSPKGEYNRGVVLVKVKDAFDDNALGELEHVSAEPLFYGSKWYAVKLVDISATEKAVTYLASLNNFDAVDYDYVMGVTADVESVDVSGNPDYGKHKHHHTHKIPDGWKYAKENGKQPGGSSDVVVAVIDTGVDYTHLDLRNNIWINTAEIADNGQDDDGNGYVDDVYGWDCVGDDNDPIDDNGHGTHVAGIIAAENNDIGGVGIAYNCKIMCIKAGNSSGYFNNSDIAKAIQYAYMNGASVINMSFGGSFISIAVEEALENAYNTCVLVAAAGNDALCNNISCPEHLGQTGVSYPAALPYVIGVMSCNANGALVSGFSNFDHYPYNSVEYEVFASGEAIPSTWPGNKYATLNGTSMAAPTVSAIAALLRSAYPDRETYSTNYLQSQIVNTGEVLAWEKTVANVYDALTKIPTPEVNLYDYYINDSTSICTKNNGNGVMDAGETVRLYISLHNRGGVASDVNVSIDTNRGEELTDPYFTFVNSTMQLSDIGTYSVRESGDKYFEIVVSGDCPNDYLVNFNIRYTYTNGMDEKDTTVYEDDGKQKAQFNVSSGYHLPSIISEDTTFTDDRLYMVGEDVIIPEGVTVTFEEGCEIQFYDDREYYNSPQIFVYGRLNLQGNKENMVIIRPSQRHELFPCFIVNYGELSFDYVDSFNLFLSGDKIGTVTNSYIKRQTNGNSVLLYVNGKVFESGNSQTGGMLYFNARIIENSVLEFATYDNFSSVEMKNNFIVMSGGEWANVKCQQYDNNILCGTPSLGQATSGYNFSYTNTVNNKFISSNENDISSLLTLEFAQYGTHYNNEFSLIYQQNASQVIGGYYDESGNPIVDIYGSCSDISLLWPYVVSVEMFNADGETITTVGREEVKVRVTFNRPMDTSKNTYLTFGTIEPYADYHIDGEWVSDTVWEGSYTLKAQIENGQNFLKVNNACAAEDETKMVFGEYQLHEFTIDTTAAMSMNLQATETDAGIELTWTQDDYDTLMGYNIYRSDSKDGNYVKLNPAILLSTEESFLDENAEPGKTYWYTFTVVLSDFSESAPAGKVMATAKDTQSPSLYHTPVNQGYENNNLVISCTASDNVAISNVTLYYRMVGASEWKTLSMVKQNDKYSATIFGSDVTLEGIEYYIVATDGNNTVQKGSSEVPYTVVIKSADSLLGMGDVDGNGAVSTKDALMLMECLNGDLLLADDEFKRADLNGDSELSSAEALRILQYINGKVTTLEM